MDYKLHRERENLGHQDNLARKRDEDRRKGEIEDERMKASIRRAAEEDIQAERRRTDEHRAKLEATTMKSRALAEAEGRIKEARENEEVNARAAAARAAADRITTLDSITESFKLATAAAGAFVLDTPRVTATVAALTAVAAGVYGSREFAKVAANLVNKRLMTPPLVRTTSLSPYFWNRLGGSGGKSGAVAAAETLDGVVLRSDVKSRVAALAAAAASTRANNANFRNILLYGPPGTGKTMVAKRMAHACGLDYAMMSGGDVAPLGRDAVTEIHKLFDWAEKSPKGLLLFIDEADAFLASRSRTNMSEDARNALNAVLYRTGEASKKIMIVLATNRPGDLDAAAVDRMDESLFIDLPDIPARRALAKLYFEQYIVTAGGSGAGSAGAAIVLGTGVDIAFAERLGERLDGFSGRAIAKLFLSAQGAVYGRGGIDGQSPILDVKLLESVTAIKMAEEAGKRDFSATRNDFSAGHGRLAVKGVEMK